MSCCGRDEQPTDKLALSTEFSTCCGVGKHVAGYREDVLTQPAPALTDLALGVVTTVLALRIRPWRGVSKHWRHAFGWTAAAALAGFVHHALFVRWQPVASVTWAVISVLVVVSLSYLLAASVEEVRGPGSHPVFTAIRGLSVLAFAVLAALMLASAVTIIACEALLMVCILVLWVQAVRTRHPMAGLMWAAMAVSALGGVGQAVLSQQSVIVGMSTYHVVQIAAFALIYLAVRRGQHHAETSTLQARVVKDAAASGQGCSNHVQD